MRSRLWFPFLFTLALALAACREAPKPAPPPLRLETRSFERSLDGCGDASKRPEPCVTFRVQWPEVVETKLPEARARMNAAILEKLQPVEAPRGLEAEAAEVIEDYEQFRDRFPNSSITYFTRRVAEVAMVNASVLCIQVTSEEFRGGAHPESTREFVNLNAATGERIELESLLRGGALERLTAAVERHFRVERGLDASQDLGEAGFTFDNNRFALPAQWGVGVRGLMFHYNPYEIAPYAAGPTAFTVPWSELDGMLRKESGLPPGRR